MKSQRTVVYTVKALSNQIKRIIHNSSPYRESGALTGMQFGVLRYVGFQDGDRDVFQRDIESEFNIRRSTATGILQLMEKNGLIHREPVDYDARLKKILLTEKSRSIQQAAAREMEEIEQRITRGIPREEMDAFFAVMEKLSGNIEY